MDKITAVMRLTRIEHSVMLMIAVAAAELMAGGIPAVPLFALSLVTPALISAGAFAINDYYDVESDRLNRRTDRPLVAGVLNRRQAKEIAVGCCAVGMAAAYFINSYVFALALVFAALAFLYSYRLKDIVLVGNAYIAFSMAVPFIFGDLVVSQGIPMSIVLISLVIFLSGLAREIHGMIRDHEGDVRARHTRNLVRYVGVKRSAQFALILYVEAIAISIFLFFYQGLDAFNPFAFNLMYIVPMTLVNLALFYVGVRVLYWPTKRFLKESRNISLAAMGLALLTYLAAVVYPILVPWVYAL